jgi:type IV secretory pathway TrbL component
MANPRNPNDPYRSPDDPYRTNFTDDEFRRAAQADNELQPDPELAEGSANSAKVAMYAIAIALVLGAVFYGLNNSSINQAGTSSTAQNTPQSTSQSSPPAAPRANTDQGMTTGAAPTRPSAPSEMNRPANPPADNTSPSK